MVGRSRHLCHHFGFDGLGQQPIGPLAQHYYKIGRITAKYASYRIDFDVFSQNCKNPRLILCRKINLVRHKHSQMNLLPLVLNSRLDVKTRENS